MDEKEIITFIELIMNLNTQVSDLKRANESLVKQVQTQRAQILELTDKTKEEKK